MTSGPDSTEPAACVSGDKPSPGVVREEKPSPLGVREDKPAVGPSGLSASVLVLNRFFAAINVVSARRALVLLYKDSAEAIDSEDGGFSGFRIGDWIRHSKERLSRPLDHEEFVRTPRFAVMVPRVIRLVACARLPKHDVKFTKRNVLVRDNHRCQYCGRKLAASRLTVDHVAPRSRSGKSTWTNVVTACTECNAKKGDRFPSEAGMRLVRPPAAPRRNPVILDKANEVRYRIWLAFVKDAAEA